MTNTIAFVAMVVPVLVLLWVSWKMPGRLKEQKAWLLQLWTAVLLLIITHVVAYLAPTKPPADYVALTRPYLDPVLTIDTAESNKVMYHYELTNVGELPAGDIKFRKASTGFNDTEFETYIQRVLAPGAQMQVIGSCVPTDLSPTSSVEPFELEISYGATVDNTERYFKSSYRFLILRSFLKPGVFRYESANHVEGGATHTEVGSQQELPTQFARPQGRVSIALNERKRNGGSANTVVASGGGREFRFDPIQRTVLFRSREDGGKVVELRREMRPTANGYHIVTLGWGPSGALLGIGGDEISEPSTFGK
jgi:hypothetical protein